MRRETRPEEEAKARQRAQVIWEVRSGKLTATEGAALLGISRQCYYDWERRALSGMTEALLNREAGRPGKPEEDPEKKAMKERLAALEKENQVLRQSAEVRQMLSAYEEWRDRPKPGKKSPK